MEKITSKEEVPTKILQSLLNKETDITVDTALENEMILNMGPQHPATHGVLRLLLRLDGETVLACVPELGYLHRGYEKMAENMSYYEFIPHTDRLDYLSPLPSLPINRFVIPINHCVIPEASGIQFHPFAFRLQRPPSPPRRKKDCNSLLHP